MKKNIISFLFLVALCIQQIIFAAQLRPVWQVGARINAIHTINSARSQIEEAARRNATRALNAAKDRASEAKKEIIALRQKVTQLIHQARRHSKNERIAMRGIKGDPTTNLIKKYSEPKKSEDSLKISMEADEFEGITKQLEAASYYNTLKEEINILKKEFHRLGLSPQWDRNLCEIKETEPLEEKIIQETLKTINKQNEKLWLCLQHLQETLKKQLPYRNNEEIPWWKYPFHALYRFFNGEKK